MGFIALHSERCPSWFKTRLPFPAAKAGLISSETPVQATKMLLENHLSGKIFNAESFGSYDPFAATHPL
jgi:hypothetical protein